MQQINQIKNKFHFEFLRDHINNKFTGEDVAKVIAVMNPERNRIEVEFNMKVLNQTNYQIKPEITYDFPNEKLAKLFETTYKNLVQNGNISSSANALELEIEPENPNKVKLKQKEATIETYINNKDITVKLNSNTKEGIEKLEKQKIQSDIFTSVSTALLNSGIYDFNKDYSIVGEFQKKYFKDAESLKKVGKSIKTLKDLRNARRESIELRDSGLEYDSATVIFNRCMITLQSPYREDVSRLIIKEIDNVSKNLLKNERGEMLKKTLYREIKGEDLGDIIKEHRPELQEALKNESGLIYAEKSNGSESYLSKVIERARGYLSKKEENKPKITRKSTLSMGIKYK